MSNYVQNNIINKKRKKKKNEMSFEDYTKIHNLKVNLSLKYEGDIEESKEDLKKSNFMLYKSNIINNKKNDSQKLNDVIKKGDKKEVETEDCLNNSNKSLNLGWHRYASASTNNSSMDEDKINNNLKNIKSSLTENKNLKTTNPINSINNYNVNINNLNTNYNSNYLNYNYQNNVNNNYKFFNGNISVNFNLNNNYNFNNMNLYYNKFTNLNYFLSVNYNLYLNKLKLIKKSINEVENEINDLEKKPLIEMHLSYQCTDLFNYINKKNKIFINNNTPNDNKFPENKEKESPEHPYFYTNHNEEIQIKNVLYLIEGLFNEDNLKKDFYLLVMLNRDGYASLNQLEKHPQIEKCKVSEKHLKIVFSEHRENEVTETVETFDDILIRNKNWRKIKKEIGDIEKIKENSLNSMERIKEFKKKKLLEKKRNYLNIQGDILYQYHINNCNIQNKIKEFNYNYNNNVYNNFNNLFNNNVYTSYYNNNNYSS